MNWYIIDNLEENYLSIVYIKRHINIDIFATKNYYYSFVLFFISFFAYEIGDKRAMHVYVSF